MSSVSDYEKSLALITISTLNKFLLRNNEREKYSEIIKSIKNHPPTSENCKAAVSFLNREGKQINSKQIAIVGVKPFHFQKTDCDSQETQETDQQLLIISMAAKKALKAYSEHLESNLAPGQHLNSNKQNDGLEEDNCCILL